MQIVCKQCQAEYEIDPPAAPFARAQDLVFRCSACGNSIPIRDGEPEATESEDLPATGYVLRQEGKPYHVRDAAMLQRWIVERRVWVDDEVSENGGDFRRVGDIDEFDVFFRLVSDADKPRGSVPATEVPEPQAALAVETEREGSGVDSGATRIRPAGLFARPEGLSVTASTADTGVPGGDGLSAADGDEEMPSFDDDTVLAEEAAVPAVASVEVEEELFGEAIPDEAPNPFGQLGPDEPTMDMELEEDDFFSEEATVVAGDRIDGADDDLDWGQARSSSMAMWWLLFLGGLGGSGYLALDWLNRADQAKEAAESVDVVEVPPAEESVKDEPAPVAEGEDVQPDPVVDEEPATEEPATEEPATEEPASDPPVNPAPPAPAEGKSAKPVVQPTEPVARSAPERISPDRESDRGWKKIDQGDWSGARAHFDRALSASPGHEDARFGMAYVNENQGRISEAVRQYCRLAASGSGDVKSEANGRLRALDKECP